MNKSLNSII